MLQIGIHYTDVLAYLLGPIRAVSAQLAQLVLPGDNPDVASLILEHESGALATLNASYASAAEHYVMNVYGKEATAYYDLQQGLRWHRRGQPRAEPVSHDSVDALVDELDEFAGAVRGLCTPEVGGEQAAASLAVILAGLISAREKRRVEIAEIWSPSAERG
jgi:predicted dehydrogenase